MDTLTFNGKAFSDFGCFFDGSKAFGSPQKDYNFVEVLGRHGSLSISNDRFKDITLSIPCFIRDDFIRNYRGLTEYLNSVQGYQRLEISTEPEHFREAIFIGPVEPSTTPYNHGGFFTIEFRCHPQRWRKDGDWYRRYTNTFGTPYNVYNPTMHASKPIFQILTADGYNAITVNGVEIIIEYDPNDVAPEFPFYIDCEAMDAYDSDGMNMNPYVSFSDEVKLEPGDNTIIEHDGITAYMKPRWFDI